MIPILWVIISNYNCLLFYYSSANNSQDFPFLTSLVCAGMLIYWKHVYTDELYDALNTTCAQAPCETLRLSDFVATYQVTTLDHFANYTVGILLIMGFVISSLLNPLVFYHFHVEVSSMVIVDLLFKILAASDFITNIYSPLFYAHEIFHPEIQASVKRTWGYIIAQGISCNVGCISQSATTLLAVARYIRLRAPFININKYVFLAFFLLYAIGMSGITVAGKYLFLQVGPGIDSSESRTALTDLCFYLNLVQCFIGVLFSILCVTSLFKSKPDASDELALKTYEMRKKGCVTILLINLPYLISLTFAMVAAVTNYKHLRALMFTFLPVFTSMLNPMILCWRNTGIRKRIGSGVRCVKMKLLSSFAEKEDYTMLDDRNNKTMASEI